MPPSNSFSQGQFAEGLFQPEALPTGIVDPAGAPAPKRYSVYKNNVIVSYIEALGAAYPACKALVGEDFFNALAREFVTQNPPNSQLMILFGEGFDAFLNSFEPAQQVPFLPDVAKIERAWRIAYHSADIAPMTGEAIAAVPPEALGDATITLLPSVATISSHFPIYNLWFAATSGGSMEQVDPSVSESALVVRPELDVFVHPIPHQFAELIEKIANGATLNKVAQAGAEKDAQFDFAQFFGLLIQTGAIAEIHHNS